MDYQNQAYAIWNDGKPHSLLVGNREFLEVPDPAGLSQELTRRSTFGAEAVDSAEAVEIVRRHYEGCLELIYSSSLWETLRSESNSAAYVNYLFENRHYLAAATYRMACGIPAELSPGPLQHLIAEHVIEEADHEIYFENGLRSLGVSADVSSLARPSPTTIEWIHVMRAVAGYSPLVAVLASGVLETTAMNRESVRGFHDRLKETGVSADSVDAIFEHIGVDMGLGHGGVWVDALTALGIVTTRELVLGLNAASTVAEQIYRWCNSLHTSALGAAEVSAKDHIDLEDAESPGNPFGRPVLPALVNEAVTWGAGCSSKVRELLSLTYAFGDISAPPIDSLGAASCMQGGQWAAEPDHVPDTVDDCLTLVASWNAAIDGHQIWESMRSDPCSGSITLGWLVENYHYGRELPLHSIDRRALWWSSVIMYRHNDAQAANEASRGRDRSCRFASVPSQHAPAHHRPNPFPSSAHDGCLQRRHSRGRSAQLEGLRACVGLSAVESRHRVTRTP